MSHSGRVRGVCPVRESAGPVSRGWPGTGEAEPEREGGGRGGEGGPTSSPSPQRPKPNTRPQPGPPQVAGQALARIGKGAALAAWLLGVAWGVQETKERQRHSGFLGD